SDRSPWLWPPGSRERVRVRHPGGKRRHCPCSGSYRDVATPRSPRPVQAVGTSPPSSSPPRDPYGLRWDYPHSPAFTLTARQCRVSPIGVRIRPWSNHAAEASDQTTLGRQGDQRLIGGTEQAWQRL